MFNMPFTVMLLFMTLSLLLALCVLCSVRIAIFTVSIKVRPKYEQKFNICILCSVNSKLPNIIMIMQFWNLAVSMVSEWPIKLTYRNPTMNDTNEILNDLGELNVFHKTIQRFCNYTNCKTFSCLESILFLTLYILRINMNIHDKSIAYHILYNLAIKNVHVSSSE